MTLYFASVLPGLEYVLSNEIRHKMCDAEITQIKRGKVFFTTSKSFACLSSLRSADNLFRFIDQFQIGPHKQHLSQLRERMSQLDLYFLDKKKSFRVNASRKGKQTYSRFEAAEVAMEGIQKRYPSWRVGTAKNHQIELRLDIEHNEVTFSLRLTDAAFRYRKKKREFSRASLLPTVAHAMVWLSDPQPTDTFVDLCCGSGTILSERVVYPANQIIGGDISSTITMLAKENLYYANVQVNVWDARKTPLNSNSVNKVVTNLPFGRQISIDEDIRSFKHHVMKEISRILIPNGTAVILSESTHQILEEAERFGFSCLKSYPLSLKGLHPALFVLEKRNTL